MSSTAVFRLIFARCVFRGEEGSGGLYRAKKRFRPKAEPQHLNAWRLLLRANVGRLGAFTPLSGHKFNLLAFLKCPETFGDDVGVMDEQIFSTTVGRNKTIPFLLVEPLDCTGAQITYSPGSDFYESLVLFPRCIAYTSRIWLSPYTHSHKIVTDELTGCQALVTCFEVFFASRREKKKVPPVGGT